MQSTKSLHILLGFCLTACAADDTEGEPRATDSSSGQATTETTDGATDGSDSVAGDGSSTESPDDTGTTGGTDSAATGSAGSAGSDSTGPDMVDPRPIGCPMSATGELTLAPAPENGITRELDTARDAEGIWFAYATWDTAPTESNRRSVRVGHVACAGDVDQESQAVASGSQSHWYPSIAAAEGSVAVAWNRADISSNPWEEGNNRSAAVQLFDAADLSALTDPVELPLRDTLSPPDIVAIDGGFRLAWIGSDPDTFEDAVWSRDLTPKGGWLAEHRTTVARDQFPAYVTVAERSGWIAFAQGFGEGVRVWNPVLDSIGTIQPGREIQLQIQAAAHLSNDAPPLVATRGQPSSDKSLPNSILLSYGNDSSIALGDPQESDVGLGLSVTPMGDIAVAYVQEAQSDGILYFQRLRITESGVLEFVGEREDLGAVHSHARLAIEWMDEGWFVAWPREDALVGRVLDP